VGHFEARILLRDVKMTGRVGWESGKDSWYMWLGIVVEKIV